MRILLTSDLHYKLRQLDWLIGAAAGFDAVVVAGDHIDAFLPVPSEVQIAALSASLAAVARKSRLLVCSGNHDLNARNVEGEKTADWLDAVRSAALAVDGETVCVGDTLFTVCPWWDGPLARERLAAQLAADETRRAGLRWVWIHHAPPRNSPTSWSGSRTMGDQDLEQWIGRYHPDLVVAGHIHQSPFVREGSWVDRIGDTWVFNAGHQYGSPPAHVALDTDANEAVWLSAMGIQSVQLGEPINRPLQRLRMPPEWFMDRDPGRIPA
jgi:Icc-related predicted phosphoesterase